MNITNINTWSDDHLPCVSFEAGSNTFEVWWTDKNLAGRLEMASEGDVTLEVALKKFKELATIVADPLAAINTLPDNVTDERNIGGDLSFNIDCGWVKVYATAESS